METLDPCGRGLILIHRKMEDWQWYGCPNMMAVFIDLLIHANCKEVEMNGMIVKRGQLVTSARDIMKRINLTRMQVRWCLYKLQSTGEITMTSTNKFSIITICNYERYQNADLAATDYEPQTPQIPITKKSLPNFTPPTLHEIEEYAKLKGLRIDIEAFWNFYESNGWMVGKNPMKSWQSALVNWLKRDKKSRSTNGIYQDNSICDEPLGIILPRGIKIS